MAVGDDYGIDWIYMASPTCRISAMNWPPGPGA